MAEKVLLVCTSTPPNVRKAIGILMSVGFRSPQIDLLCKSIEIQEYEKKVPIQHVWVFPNRQAISGCAGAFEANSQREI